jgi:poly-beta-1,6-N-acetyl-D-glucosamine synthase
VTVGCDVVIMAHNESSTINGAIRAVLNQDWTSGGKLSQLLVVSTASTDGTDDIVRELARDHCEITLLALPKRRGKTFDVNEAVRCTASPVLVIMDADVFISESCIAALLAPFAVDPTVGMTVPARSLLNPRKGLMNRIGHLAAEVQNTAERPKPGQVIAIRREYARVDERVSVDDAYQEFSVWDSGLRVIRVPAAVVTSRAPETLPDYIKQRRRVAAQYLTLHRVTRYRPVTRSWWALARTLPRTTTVGAERRVDIVLLAALIDGAARMLGAIDYFALRRTYATWQAATTTKSHA